MPTIPVVDYHAVLDAVTEHGSAQAAALALGIAETTFRRRLRTAQAMIDKPVKSQPPSFEVDALPSELPTAAELIARRSNEFARRHAADKARQLITVRIKADGPIGIMHVGDPHIDDPGTDISLLQEHIELANKTPGLFAANVGDLHNNWVGRLARLYGQQSTSQAEAWVLVEWLFQACKWLYLCGGNHDVWSGAGDASKWIARFHGTLYEWHGARVGLVFPNKREIRINARHDFPGRSIYNAAHGPARAARFGWRDHILTCGHTHTSGYQILKDPMSGLISHAIRVGSYKALDSYAKQQGYFDETAFVAPVTIIDPSKADNDPGCVTFMPDPHMAADFLKFLRKKKS